MDIPKMLAVDVDGTLLKPNGEINAEVVRCIRQMRAQGFTVMLWSMQGVEYAKRAASLCDPSLFDHIIPKPGYILDDYGWRWIRYTRIVRMTQAGWLAT